MAELKNINGPVNITDDDGLFVKSTTNGGGAQIKFSDLSTDNSYAQVGHIKYYHANGSSYGSSESFVIGGTETSMTILADGKLMYSEGIYTKPGSGTGAGTRKDINWNTAYTYSQVGHLPLDGGTMTGDVKLNDNVEVEFGTSSDVKMKFDGSNLVTTVPTGSSFMIGTNGGTPHNNGGAADFVVDVNSDPRISFYSGQVQVGGTDMNWNAYLAYSGNTKLGAWDNNIYIFTQGGGGASAKNIYLRPQAAGGGTTTVATFNGDTGTTLTGAWSFGDVSGGSFKSYGYGTELDISSLNSGGWARAHRIITSDSSGQVFFGVIGNNTATTRAYWTLGDPSSIDSTGYNSSNGIVLLKDGKVGIGDSSPSYKLDVNGDARITSTFHAGSDVNIGGDQLTFTNDAASAYIRGADALFIESDWNNNDGSSKPIYFRTNGAEMARFEATVATFAGELEAASLDINGNADISGALTVYGINDKVGTSTHLRNYELSTGDAGGSFLIGKIEHSSSTDGAISATVHFAYDYGTTTNNCTLHFNFAQRTGTARGTWWYEADDQDGANDRVHARLIDDGSGNMYVWITCVDYARVYVEARHRFSSNFPSTGTLTAATITSGTTLFDTANDPTAEMHVGNVFAHGEVEATSLDINGNADVSGSLTIAGAIYNAGNVVVAQGSPKLILKDTTDNDDHGIIFRDESDNDDYKITTQDFTSAATGAGLFIGSDAISTKVCLVTNDTTALTLDTSQNATFAGNVNISGESLYLYNPSNNYWRVQNNTSGKLVFRQGTTQRGIWSSGELELTNDLKVGGNVDVNGIKITVGTNGSIFAENNLRFKSSGAAYIDHNTTGQSIKFRLSNGSALDVIPLEITPTYMVSTTDMYFGDNKKLKMGDNPDLQIYHNGSHSFIQDTGEGDLRLLGSSIKLQNTSEANILTLASDLSATFAGDVSGVDTLTALNLVGTPVNASTNSLKLGRTDVANYWYVNHAGNDFRLFNSASSGSHILFGVDASGNVKANNVGIGTPDPEKKLHVVGDVKISEHLLIAPTKKLYFDSGNHTYLTESTDNNLQIVTGGTITAQFAGTGLTLRNTQVNGTLYVGSNGTGHDVKFFGDAADKYMLWDASANELRVDGSIRMDNSGGNFTLKCDTGNLKIQVNEAGHDLLLQSDDGFGGIATYLKLDGGTVKMNAAKNIEFQDNVKAEFGAGDDLEIYHDGTDSFINNDTGNLNITNNQDDGFIDFKADNGTSGLDTYLRVDGTQHTIDVFKQTHFYDNVKATFGHGNDLQIYHDSSNSYIKDNGIGSLVIESSDLFLRTNGTENSVVCAANAGVTLYYDNVAKLATSSSGVSVTGAMTASGDVVAFSDKKLKENIETLDGKKVLDMRGVSFTRKDTGKESSGVIAQEIQKVAPELVHDTEGTLGVSYGNLVGYLIEAVKDQQKQIDELKAIINGSSK